MRISIQPGEKNATLREMAEAGVSAKKSHPDALVLIEPKKGCRIEVGGGEDVQWVENTLLMVLQNLNEIRQRNKRNATI